MSRFWFIQIFSLEIVIQYVKTKQIIDHFIHNTCTCTSITLIIVGIEFLQVACSTRLGMADNRIPDSSLSVSSSRTGHGKEKARYGCCANENGGAWCPADSDHSPWYEVNFDKPQSVGGFDFLQPSHPPNVFPSEYMKTFELQYWLALDAQKKWRSFNKVKINLKNDKPSYLSSLNNGDSLKSTFNKNKFISPKINMVLQLEVVKLNTFTKTL